MQILKEQSWENIWHLLDLEENMDLLEQCHNSNSTTDEDEFLRDILLQEPIALSDENEGQSFVKNNSNTNTTIPTVAGTTTVATGKRLSTSSSSSPRTYIISFDKSTTLPAIPETSDVLQRSRSSKSNSPLSSKKRNLENLNLESKSNSEKKRRSDSQNLYHIMLERKRRQDLAVKFVALSAIIPGLKKTDKNSIVLETIDYVKLLQERVMELEQRNKQRCGKEPMIMILNQENVRAKGYTCTRTTTSSDSEELLPDVKAKVLEKEILIEIICEKKNGTELIKILDLLQKLHLFVTCSSVFPFAIGNSAALSITIIAKMDTAYRMTMIDLVENVRQLLLNDIQSSTN